MQSVFTFEQLHKTVIFCCDAPLTILYVLIYACLILGVNMKVLDKLVEYALIFVFNMLSQQISGNLALKMLLFTAASSFLKFTKCGILFTFRCYIYWVLTPPLLRTSSFSVLKICCTYCPLCVCEVSRIKDSCRYYFYCCQYVSRMFSALAC